jgi:methionyl-tRNA formyltransferase
LDRKKVLLFAMTGFGNNAFNVLSRMRSIDLMSVFIPRRNSLPFPYYECVALYDVVSRHKEVQLFEDIPLRAEATYRIIKGLFPDLIVVSSFNQILPREIISIPRLGVINLHPSLLPKYRGPTPTAWVLMNGEKETGVTVHFIEDERIDSGRIITQGRLEIVPSDTDGTLRCKLAIQSEEVLAEAIQLVICKDREMFPEQNESEASYYPKRTIADSKIDLQEPFEKIRNRIRAATPYPGAYLKHKGFEYLVLGAALLPRNASWSRSVEPANGLANRLCLPTADGIIKLDVRRKMGHG